MLKALAWKEYREQRQIALMGLLVSALLPVLFIVVGSFYPYTFNPHDLVQMSSVAGIVLVWPIFAAVAGAATNPREARVASLAYLLSRPISRVTVWAVKVGLGLASLATIALGSIVIFWAVQRIAWGPGLLISLGSVDAPEAAWLIGFLALAFACSVLYATLTASALVAAGGGLVTSLVIHAFVYGFWAFFGVRRGYERVSTIEIGLATLMVLAGAVYAFSRGELLRGPRVRRTVLIQAISALGVLLVISSTAGFALTRVNLSNAVFTYPELSPAGDVVAVRANRANFSAAQIWLIDLEGEATQLAGRGSRDAVFSPDGEWVAYSILSYFYGYPPVRLDLRLASADRSEDRRLGTSIGGIPVFSPDGSKLAAAVLDELAIAHLDRDEVEILEVPGASDFRGYSRVRWTPAGDELLLGLLRAAPNRTLAFYQLDSGSFRFFDPPGDWMSSFSYALPAERPVPSRMPVRGFWRSRSSGASSARRDQREYGIGLIDRDSLEGTVVVRGGCRTATLDLSADERFLAYSACDERQPAQPVVIPARSTVRLRDLASGEDLLLASFRGLISRMMFNPSGTRVLVSIGYVSQPFGVAVVGAGSEVQMLGEFTSAVGWLDDQRALLARHPDWMVPREARSRPYLPTNEVLSLVVVDIETGEERTIFSR